MIRFRFRTRESVFAELRLDDNVSKRSHSTDTEVEVELPGEVLGIVSSCSVCPIADGAHAAADPSDGEDAPEDSEPGACPSSLMSARDFLRRIAAERDEADKEAHRFKGILEGFVGPVEHSPAYLSLGPRVP